MLTANLSTSMQKQFEVFLENIKLTAAQREDAVTKYTGVCKALHDYYYPDSKYDGTAKLLIGSYGKHTNIRPARDIDVIFMIPPDRFSQYDDNTSNKQSQLLNDVKCILEETYPNTPIRAFGKVVVVEFAETKHNVELLPAWEYSDGTFCIPNSEGGGSWERWDPRREMKRISESDAETHKTRSLIRMVKKWSENCTAKVKSFEIEEWVMGFFAGGVSPERDFPEMLKQFFGYAVSTAVDPDLKSHLKTALNRATKACEFEADDDLEGAADEWRKIFGNDFPAALWKAAMSEEAMPPLADHSHCEPLKWPLAQTATVRVDAGVYDAGKKNKLGGLNSDGRNLPPGLRLRYQARTAARGPLDYYWQVVNTGPAARADGGLRGTIFSGEEVQWESTKYPGKHWIECFLIQGNVCIGRSGRFFVNIK